MVADCGSHAPIQRQSLRKEGGWCHNARAWICRSSVTVHSCFLSCGMKQAWLAAWTWVLSLCPTCSAPPPSDKHLRNLSPFWSQQRSMYSCTHLAAKGCRPGALACDLSYVINTCECKLGRSKLSRSGRLIFKFQTCRHNSEIPWLRLKFAYQIKLNICLTEL